MLDESKRKCPLCSLTIKQCWGYKDAEEIEDQKREEVKNADVAGGLHGHEVARERHIESDDQAASGEQSVDKPEPQPGSGDGDEASGHSDGDDHQDGDADRDHETRSSDHPSK